MRARHGSLSAGQPQRIQLGDVPLGASIYVANVSRGEPIYVQLDGTDAAVRGDDTSIVFSFRRFSILVPTWTGAPVTSISLVCKDDTDFAVEVSR